MLLIKLYDLFSICLARPPLLSILWYSLSLLAQENFPSEQSCSASLLLILLEGEFSQLANYSLGSDVRQENFPMNMSSDLMDGGTFCVGVHTLYRHTFNGVHIRHGRVNPSRCNKSYVTFKLSPFEWDGYGYVSMSKQRHLRPYTLLTITDDGERSSEQELPRLWNKLLHQQCTLLHWWR